MRTVPKRSYTPEFRDAAVKQVIDGGLSIASAARSPEMSSKSLANFCTTLNSRFYSAILAICWSNANRSMMARTFGEKPLM